MKYYYLSVRKLMMFGQIYTFCPIIQGLAPDKIIQHMKKESNGYIIAYIYFSSLFWEKFRTAIILINTLCIRMHDSSC